MTTLADLLEEMTPDGDYVRAVLAAKVVARWREIDPAGLAAWLDEQAEHFVTTYLGKREASQRARTRLSGPARAFGQAASEVASGALAVGVFAVRYTISDDMAQRRFADMTRADCLYVATQYDSSAKADLLEAAFLRAVGKRLGATRRVSDIFSEASLTALRRRISGLERTA